MASESPEDREGRPDHRSKGPVPSWKDEFRHLLFRLIPFAALPLLPSDAPRPGEGAPTNTMIRPDAPRIAHDRLDRMQWELDRIGVFSFRCRGETVSYEFQGNQVQAILSPSGDSVRTIRMGPVDVAFSHPLPVDRLYSCTETLRALLERTESKRDPLLTAAIGQGSLQSEDGMRFSFTQEGHTYLADHGSTFEVVSPLPNPADYQALADAREKVQQCHENTFRFIADHGIDRPGLLSPEERKVLSPENARDYDTRVRALFAAQQDESKAYTQCTLHLLDPHLGPVKDITEDPNLPSFTRSFTDGDVLIQESHHLWNHGYWKHILRIPPGSATYTREQYLNGRLETRSEHRLGDGNTMIEEHYRHNGSISSRRTLKPDGSTWIEKLGEAGNVLLACSLQHRNGKEEVGEVHMLQSDGTILRHYPVERAREQREGRDLTPDRFLDRIARYHADHERLNLLISQWLYVFDSPDPKHRWEHGTADHHGGVCQSPEETLRRQEHEVRGEVYHVGDCEDISLLTQELLRRQGKKSHVIVVPTLSPDGQANQHAICVWLEQRPDGRFNVFSSCTFGLSQNGLPFDEADPHHEGFASPEDALEAVRAFFRRSGLRITLHAPSIKILVPHGNGDYLFSAITAAHLHPDAGDPPPSMLPAVLEDIVHRMKPTDYLIVGSFFLPAAALALLAGTPMLRRRRAEIAEETPHLRTLMVHVTTENGFYDSYGQCWEHDRTTLRPPLSPHSPMEGSSWREGDQWYIVWQGGIFRRPVKARFDPWRAEFF